MKAAAPSLMMNSEIRSELAKADRDFVVEPLLEPKLEEPRRRRRLYEAHGHEGAQILPGDALAVDLVAVGVEQEPLPADDLFHLRLDDNLEPAVVVGALLDAAVRVAEHLADVIDAEGDAAARERGAYSTRVGQLLREARCDRWSGNPSRRLVRPRGHGCTGHQRQHTRNPKQSHHARHATKPMTYSSLSASRIDASCYMPASPRNEALCRPCVTVEAREPQRIRHGAAGTSDSVHLSMLT